MGPLYPQEVAFLEGYMETRLIGVPLGRADVVAIPPDEEADTEGLFRITGGIPEGSWLTSFIDSTSLTFEMRQAPPQKIEDRFQELQTVMAAMRDGEPYEDGNGNEQFDEGESFTDVDGNGAWDGPAGEQRLDQFMAGRRTSFSATCQNCPWNWR